MIFELQDVLNAQEISDFQAALDGEEFVDGRETAQNAASLVKKNVQLPAASSVRAALGQRLENILRENSNFTWLVMPKRIGPFHFSRYEMGMTYGDHVDNSLMGLEAGNPMRADLSITVFLNDPSEYDGGELIMNSHTSPKPIKLAAGSVIIYPTGEFHRVEPVTKGVRKVAIAWIESVIRGEDKRQIMTDVWSTMNGLADLTPREQLDKNQAYQTLSKAHWSLLRLWSET